MYKSNHIFVYSLCGTRLTLHFLSHMDLDLGCGQTCAKYTSWCTQASMKNTLITVLISSLWRCCIFNPTTIERLLPREGRTQQLHSWEFWGVWYLDWQQRTSKLFTASVPTLCQAVALTKRGPIYAHFNAICGISSPQTWTLLVDKTFRKCTTFIRDPNLAEDITAKGQRWARSCCSAQLNHSWGVYFFDAMHFNPKHDFHF